MQKLGSFGRKKKKKRPKKSLRLVMQAPLKFMKFSSAWQFPSFETMSCYCYHCTAELAMPHSSDMTCISEMGLTFIFMRENYVRTNPLIKSTTFASLWKRNACVICSVH